MADLRALIQDIAAAMRQPAPRWFGRRRHAAEQRLRGAILESLQALAAEQERLDQDARHSQERFQATTGKFEAYMEQSAARLQALATQNRQWLDEIERLRHQLALQEVQIQKQLPALVEDSAASVRRQLAQRDEQMARDMAELRDAHEQGRAKARSEADAIAQRHAAETAELRGAGQELADRLRALQEAQHQGWAEIATELKALRGHADQSLAEAKRSLAATQDAREEVSAEFAGLLDRIAALAVTPARPAPDPQFSSFYLELERRHRGSRDLIVRRLQQYAEPIQQWAEPFARQLAGKALLDLATYDPRTTPRGGQRIIRTPADLPALDLGCGRGEWLQHLAQNQWRNILGVDRNPLMIEECRQHGALPAVEADLLESLRHLPDSSLALVTVFHVAEHLPFAELRELVAETLRVLHPGGLCIFETPNPENLLTASLYFHLDPTHQRPLPVDLLKLVLEQAGFQKVETLRFQPNADLGFLPAKLPAQHPDPTVQLLLNHFRASQDYALVALRP